MHHVQARKVRVLGPVSALTLSPSRFDPRSAPLPLFSSLIVGLLRALFLISFLAC